MLDYATDETAFLIPARPGQFAECRVGDLETIERPWLFEPDADALVELLRRVVADRAGARAKGLVASEWIRSRFTWDRTVDAVEERLLALAAEMPDQPRMNTDEHGWDVVRQTPRHEGAGELARNGSPIPPSGPSPICVHLCSSVAHNPPVSRARTSLTMQGKPAGRGRSLLAAGHHAEASRAILQRRPGHLRSPDAAQPGRARRRAGRPCQGRCAVATGVDECPRHPEAMTILGRPGPTGTAW